LLPLFDDGVMQEFWHQNSWIRNKLPNATQSKIADYRKPEEHFQTAKLIYDIANKTHTLKIIEKTLKWIQQKVLPKEIKQKMNKNTDVVITDKILKFHTTDNREKIRDNWKNIIKQYEELS